MAAIVTTARQDSTDHAQSPVWTEARLRPAVVGLALALILVTAALFRLMDVNWDSGQHLHPDERFIVMVDTGIAWPSSLSQFFDSARSPLNPYNRGFGNFVYGTLPLFLLKAAGTFLNRDTYDGIVGVGRVLSALSDVGSVLLLFFAGRRLYGAATGLLAAAFLALSVLGIQLSHFMAVDTFTVFFLMLSFYFAARLMQGGSLASAISAGVSFGMALACKLSIALIPLLVAAALGLRLYYGWPRHTAAAEDGVDHGQAPAGEEGQRDSLLSALGKLLASLGAAFVAFRICQPYAFSGLFSLSSKWVQDEAQQKGFISGVADVPFLLQWAHTPPILFPLKDIALWGMGPPLAAVCFAGIVAACLAIVKRGQIVHLLPLAWIGANLVYLGVQQSKTMRYFYQLYPFLALLGAWLCVALTHWAVARRREVAAREGESKPPTPSRLEWGHALAMFALAGAACWSFAFTRIYTRPNTRVAASEWIYQHIPAGSTLAVEHWDDALPLNLSGPDQQSSRYKQVTLTLYDDDSPSKITMIVNGLQQSDYLILSSNRLYASIPRIPQRYPMTIAYYRALFDGQLGFQLADTQASYPTLLGLPINDDRVAGYQGLAALLQPDEAFTVYDHPKVLIFKKTPAFSGERVRQMLSAVPLDGVQHLNPKQASLSTTNLMLSPSDRAADTAGGTWSRLFDRASWENRVPPLAWWAGVESLGLIAFPLLFLIFRRAWDGGWLLAKTGGLLLLAYASWIGPSLHLVQYTRLEVAGAGLAIGLVALVFGIIQARSIGGFMRAHWRRLVLADGLFAILFAFFFLIRTTNPDLWHPVLGGEKPMDFAFLNATMKSSYFPPYDPWFAGGYINYYYFGFVLVGTLIKLLGIVPAVAYNLAVPLLPALTCAGAFSVVASVVSWPFPPRGGLHPQAPELAVPKRFRMTWRPAAFGLLAAMFIGIIGNLGEITLVFQGLLAVSGAPSQSRFPGLDGLTGILGGLGQLLAGQPLPFRLEWWYWNASRVIPDTINEFPFFTFLYGDLHAHALALPLAVLGIGAGFAFVGEAAHRGLLPAPRRLAGLCLLGLVIGALKATNTWDYPTYLVLTAALLLLAHVTSRKALDWQGLWLAGFETALVFLVAAVLFWPYSQHFATLYNSVQLWTGPRTELGAYLTIHGIFLFGISAFLLWASFGPGSRSTLGRMLRLLWRNRRRPAEALRRLSRSTSTPASRYGLAFWTDCLLLFVLILAGLALLRLWVPLLLVTLLGLSASALLDPGSTARSRAICLLVGLGLCLDLAVEFLVVAGDIGRMNTVFKLDYQVWVLWSLAAALGIAELHGRLRPGFSRSLVLRGTAVLLTCGLTYTIGASIARAHDRFTPLPLTDNGQAYMAVSTWQDQRPIPLGPDAAAITWMQDHIQGSPVVLEGRGKLYSWASRISVYTGLPTVLGWDWHEIQQRGLFGNQEIDARMADVTNMYSNPSLPAIMPLLQKYQVKYVYVGGFERETYPAVGLAKFSSLPAVYDDNGTTIYAVP